MKEIRIEDFITIKILELNKEEYVYFVDYYNEKYFYMKDNNELCSCPRFYTFYNLYFKKAETVYRDDLEELEKDIYFLHRQLTFKIDRATEEQDYYFISSTFKVERVTDYNGIRSNSHYNLYNYFLSEEEATKCAKKLREYLIELRKEEYCNEQRN